MAFAVASSARRLLELLIQFRSIDFRQKLAGLYPATDVHVPALQVTIRPRINGSIDKRLNVPRQNDFFLRRAALGLRERNRGHGKQIGVRLHIGSRANTSCDAAVKDKARNDSGKEQTENYLAHTRRCGTLPRHSRYVALAFAGFQVITFLGFHFALPDLLRLARYSDEFL